LEEEFEGQIEKLRKEVAKQEEKEKERIRAENEAKIKRLQEDYARKLKKEREKKDQEFQQSLKRIESNEKKKADLEVENYKREQKKKLEEKLMDLGDLNNEKEKLQQEFTSRYNSLKSEYQRKIEEEKKKIEGKYIIVRFRRNT
jgi:hypothetical protein